MSLVALVDALRDSDLADDDGHRVDVALRQPMSPAEIAAAESRLGTAFPPPVRALLEHCRGIDGLLAEIDFSGQAIEGASLDDLFPRVCTIAHDGYGNFWAVDLLQADTEAWPIWFLCHDPPVALFQCDGLERFVRELERMFTPPHESLIDDVHEDRVHRVGRTNPGTSTWAEAMASPDPLVRDFAAGLDDRFDVVDLRGATPGMGISWGRFGPWTEHRRLASLPVFGLGRPARRGVLSRLRGG